MPSFTNQVADLATVGPVVEVLVGPSHLFAQVMAKKGKPVPNPVKATAMVDTGASGTVVTPALIQQLGLRPVGVTSMNTPSTTKPMRAPQYHLSLVFPNGVSVPSLIGIEAPLGGQHIECLIGRDVLKHGVLTYIGYINQFTLSF